MLKLMLKMGEKMKARNVFVTFMLVSVVLSLLVGVSGAAWCDTDFGKRINVSVNNTGGSALTDYQVYVNLSANPINETSLRVYNASDCTLRPHWCESITNGNCTKLWINYSVVAASSWTNDTSIYHDNDVASSTSNISTTFLFGDDFEDGDTIGWALTVSAGNTGVSTNVVTDGTSKVLKINSTTYGTIVFYTTYSFTNAIIESKVKMGGPPTNVNKIGELVGRNGGTVTSGYSNAIYQDSISPDTRTNKIQKTHVATLASQTWNFNYNQYYHLKLVFNGTSIKSYVNDTMELSVTDSSYVNGYVGCGANSPNTTGAFFDDIRARKYTLFEPNVILGEEEEKAMILTLASPTEAQEFLTATIWINGTTNANAIINFSIDAGANETACTNCLSFSNLTSTLSEGSHNVTVYAINYTDNTDTDTKTRNFCINTLAPQWANQTQNVSFIYENSSIKLFANGTDATGLDYAWLATNETGTWQNYTTIDSRAGIYQMLSHNLIHTAECGSHDTFTAYSELTGDHSKYLFSYTPTSNSVQSAAFSWYFLENNTWDVDHVIYNSTAVDANSMVVINETRWLYSWREISSHILYETWTNDSGNTWSSHVTSSLYPEFEHVLFVPIENDTSKAISIGVTAADPNSVYKLFFYRENESYSNKEFLWTKGEAGEQTMSKIITLNNVNYMFINSRSGSAYAKYVHSTNLSNWSSPVITNIPHKVGTTYPNAGVNWAVDCDKDTCYAITSNPNSPYRHELYSINKSLFTSNDWTYRLDLNVTDAWHGTLKIINNTHLIASARDHGQNKQYGILVKTHTETSSMYGSPINLGGSTNWEWANFTWQNAAYNNTKIYWKICFNDTSGLSNCTDIMSFDIIENATTPAISNVVNGSVSSTSQYIDWDVNQTAHNRVLYSNESDLTPAYYSTWNNSTAAPNITLSGLDASTQYWYQAWSYNTTNNSLSDNSSTLSFTTAAATSTLHIDNAINIKDDWGRDFYSNFSANATGANASNVWMNFTNVEFTNTSLGWLNLTLNEWVNESHNVNSPVSNVSVITFLNASGATNGTDSFWYEVTNRTNTATMDSAATHNANTSEIFYVNATCNEEYGDTFLGGANLLEDGVIVATNSSVTNYVNFSSSESSAGQYNYTVRFYNLTHYNNVTTLTYSNVTVTNQPPAPPQNLTNLSYAATYVELDWDDNTEGDLQGYEVFRNTSLALTIDPPVSEGNDTGLPPSTYYCYVVRAYDDVGGRSDNSSQTCVWTASGPLGEYIPPDPTTLANSTGNFWINHTWNVGSGNVTNSYNVSIGAVWYNTTTVTYHNDTGLSAHDWSNVTVWAYNTSGSGSLSNGNISDNVRISNNIPVLNGLPDNTTTEDINQTDIFDLDDYFTDVDTDAPTYLVESNNQSAYVDVTINASNNVSYILASGWNGTASVVINATDGYGGEDNDTFLIIVNAAPLPGDYIPGDPTTLANTTGNYWVNYTWNVGGGNVTDSYNVSWNLTWYNTTTDTFMKKEVGASNWANITIYAYNSSGNGSLSTGSVSDNVQAPAFVPGDYIPPTPTTLQNTTGNYYVNYTWVMGVPSNITDSYNVSWNLSWFNGTLTTYMQKEVGASGWANITVYAFNSSGNGSLSAGYISDEVQAPSALPGDYPPATPTTLANTTGNSWVHYTWSSGGGANITDSYNVSWNLSWYNNTLVAYMNDTVGEFGWANISVWAFNSSGNGSMSAGSISDETQADGGTFTTSMGTIAYNLITYYGSTTSTAEQFGLDIGSVDYIAMYNGSFYTHTMGFVANNFTTYHGIGYYVYLNASGSSTYQRNNISDVPYNTQLFNRWNTVGWTNATDTNAEGVAISIGSVCKYTSSLNADGVTYTTHTVGFTSNNHDVDKGKGYWVWVNTNTNWNRNS